MNHGSSERNLLVGILAIQMDFISRDQLVAAMHGWVADKAQLLEDVLLEQEAIDANTRDLILGLVEKHLGMHQGDAQRSLAAVSSVASSVQEELKSIADSDVEASLKLLPTRQSDSGHDGPVLSTTVDVGTGSAEGLRSAPAKKDYLGWQIPSGDGGYTVIARRYRPQTFDQLVGQQHVIRALINAIETNRVGHAYLFCGKSGIGKTSLARIFAKALQCVNGPTTTPCNQCDICQCISSGDDVDVMEINGARHRGVNNYVDMSFKTRPWRARFKIYIIDQVDFLTPRAQMSLLDILEEPPAHVKFIFCTSDPDRLLRPMLSRLQRFDFFPVGMPAIVERLLHIVETEGVRAEPEALKILAQLADGSVRESQSLLESLFSPSGSDEITAQSVHQMHATVGTHPAPPPTPPAASPSFGYPSVVLRKKS